MWPIVVVSDRYNGAYSGAKWTAWNNWLSEIPREIEGGDTECWDFWRDNADILVGKGATPQEALKDLKAKSAAMGTAA
jgi:hypothetical protein